MYYELRVNLLKLKLIKLDIPNSIAKEDEFPLVPFMFGSEGTNAYDSTAILKHLGVDKNLNNKD
jgi:hypothetical protein